MRVLKDDVHYICGYRLIYPYLKKEMYGTKVNFYNKYLIALNSKGDFFYVFVSRVNILTGYEVFGFSKHSNFFKLCRSIYGCRDVTSVKFAGIKPNDLIGKYFAVIKGNYVKAPKNVAFEASIASKCLSFFSGNAQSMAYLDEGMIKNFVLTKNIKISSNTKHLSF